MRIKTSILLLALLGLFVAQFATAHHNVTHFNHEISLSSFGDHPDPENSDPEDHHSPKHTCPECILSKAFQTAFFNAPVVIFYSSIVKQPDIKYTSVYISHFSQKANNPRAPPTFLI